jgi:hypothetical protein
MEIVDGPTKYQLPLTAAQLRSGSLTYGHQTDVVDVHLRLATGVAESVNVTTAHPPQPLPASSPLPGLAPAPAPVMSASVSNAPPRVIAVPAAESLRQTDRQADWEEPGKESALSPVAASKPFVPVAESRSAPHVALPDPPQVAGPPVRAQTVALASKLPVTIPAVAPPQMALAPKLPMPSPGGVPPTVVGEARSGRLIWTGYLERRETVEFDGSKPSLGSVSGTLPGKLARLVAFPAEFKGETLRVYTTEASRNNQTEAPAPVTGWNRLLFDWDPERVKQITVVEAPSAANQFARLVLRNDARTCRAIVVEWRVE